MRVAGNYGIRFTNKEIKEVIQFVEKPDIDTAKLYVASGKYLWNAGMFAWHVNTIIQQYLALAPTVYDILMKGQAKYNTPEEASWLQQHYHTTENISVDFAIMEKSDCVFTMAASFDWSDLGIWSSIYEVSEKDEQANVFIAGGGSLEDNFNNLIILPTGKQVIIKGIKVFLSHMANCIDHDCLRSDDEQHSVRLSPASAE